MALISARIAPRGTSCFLVLLLFQGPLNAQDQTPKQATANPETQLRKLIVTLSDKDAEIRSSALHKIGKLGSVAKKATPKLVEMLVDPDQGVRAIALHSIKKIGFDTKFAGEHTIAILIRVLKDQDPFLRRFAATQLGKFGSAARSAVNPLNSTLKDSNEKIRTATFNSLRQIGMPNGPDLKALIETLRDERTWIRARAVDSLANGKVDENTVLPILIHMQEDKEKTIRAKVAFVLGVIGARSKDPRAFIPVLCHAVKDKETSVAKTAIASLGKLGPPAELAIPNILSALRENVPSLDDSVEKALLHIGPKSVPELIGVLQVDKSWKVRLVAVKTLGRFGAKAKAAVPALALALNDLGWVPQHAAKALGQIGSEAKAAIPALVKALESGSRNVRNSAAESLGKIQCEEDIVLPALINALKNKNAEFCSKAIFALRQFKERAIRALPDLLIAVESPHSQVRTSAMLALPSIAPNSEDVCLALIKRVLEDEDFRNRSCAALMLGNVAFHRKTVPTLITALQNENRWERSSIADALASLGPQADAAVPALIKILKERDGRDRDSIAYALGRVGAAIPTVVPALIKALEDKNSSVRHRALDALAEIGEKAEKAVPALILSLKKENLWDRLRAARALGNIGPKGKKAKTALTALRNEKNHQVKCLAIYALCRIGEKPNCDAELLQILHEALADSYYFVKLAAVESLGMFGHDAVSAVPAVLKNLQEFHVARYIIPTIETLGKISAQSKYVDEVRSGIHPLKNHRISGVRDMAAKVLKKLPPKKTE